MQTIALISPEQIQAYAAAVYEVELDGVWISAERLPIAASGHLPRSMISACNPYSQSLSEAANIARHQQLAELIHASGVSWWPARGRSADFSWHEPSFLVEADLNLVDRWARRFGQHAIWLPSAPGSLASIRIYADESTRMHDLDLPTVRLEWVGFDPTPAD